MIHLQMIHILCQNSKIPICNLTDSSFLGVHVSDLRILVFYRWVLL